MCHDCRGFGRQSCRWCKRLELSVDSGVKHDCAQSGTVAAQPQYAPPMTPPVTSSTVTIFDHPLIQHKLTWMRDKSLSDRPFRALLAQIAGLMVYEVTREFPTKDVEVLTP